MKILSIYWGQKTKHQNITDIGMIEKMKQLIKINIMIFAEVIEGLKNGQNFTRINSPALYGKFITMQIPTDIPTDIIPKMTSLNDGAKTILGTVGDCQVHYRNQVLMVNKVDGEENIATYYIPTWEDIFADDWVCV